MQAEAGEGLSGIARRKELERISGGGKFWWGVGESRGKAVERLVKSTRSPAIIFTPMLGSAASIDENPSQVALWQSYVSGNGNKPIPKHVIVTSRAHTASGQPKTSHYALACEARQPLALGTSNRTLYASQYRNLGGASNRLGSSQVTMVVEPNGDVPTGQPYEVAMRGVLTPPYFVTLTDPRILTKKDRLLLKKISQEGKTTSDWQEVVRMVRR